MPVLISVLTPTWNRCRYLERVFYSLTSQSFLSFEWIISDDGSTDDTSHSVRQFAEQAVFPITYIRADRHVGKARMDNEAIRQAKGELILWCDSDDWLLPNTLERLWQIWSSIPPSQRNDFSGVTALAETERGIIANPLLSLSHHDVSWNDLAEVHHVTGDMLFCARADLLKSHPFPEVDLLIPESVVWTAIGHIPSRFVPEVLKMVEYHSAHAISFSGLMNYNRGRAYALAATVRNLSQYDQRMKIRFWRLVTFIRYCFHGEISLHDARRLWGSNGSGYSFWLVYPFAILLACKDSLQGKVRKSHREFLANKDIANITIQKFNSDTHNDH